MKTLFAHGLLVLVLAAPTAQMPGLTVSISVDQRVYAVGEPVRLHVTLRNTGPDALLGHFNLSSSAPFVRPEYRRDGAPGWSSFATEAALHPGDVWYGIRTLTPGDERSADVAMWWNGLDTTFPFAAPGRYEVRVVYDDERGRSGTRVVGRETALERRLFERATGDARGHAER
jgi:hypothetical protein